MLIFETDNAHRQWLETNFDGSVSKYFAGNYAYADVFYANLSQIVSSSEAIGLFSSFSTSQNGPAGFSVTKSTKHITIPKSSQQNYVQQSARFYSINWWASVWGLCFSWTSNECQMTPRKVIHKVCSMQAILLGALNREITTQTVLRCCFSKSILVEIGETPTVTLVMKGNVGEIPISSILVWKIYFKIAKKNKNSVQLTKRNRQQIQIRKCSSGWKWNPKMAIGVCQLWCTLWMGPYSSRRCNARCP